MKLCKIINLCQCGFIDEKQPIERIFVSKLFRRPIEALGFIQNGKHPKL